MFILFLMLQMLGVTCLVSTAEHALPQFQAEDIPAVAIALQVTPAGCAKLKEVRKLIEQQYAIIPFHCPH